jgi:hypothetical protein
MKIYKKIPLVYFIWEGTANVKFRIFNIPPDLSYINELKFGIIITNHKTIKKIISFLNLSKYTYISNQSA